MGLFCSFDDCGAPLCWCQSLEQNLVLPGDRTHWCCVTWRSNGWSQVLLIGARNTMKTLPGDWKHPYWPQAFDVADHPHWWSTHLTCPCHCRQISILAERAAPLPNGGSPKLLFLSLWNFSYGTWNRYHWYHNKLSGRFWVFCLKFAANSDRAAINRANRNAGLASLLGWEGSAWRLPWFAPRWASLAETLKRWCKGSIWVYFFSPQHSSQKSVTCQCHSTDSPHMGYIGYREDGSSLLQ